MPIASAMFARDLAAVEADIVQTFSVITPDSPLVGRSFPCVAGDDEHEHTMDDIVGYNDDRNVRITVRLSVFAPDPPPEVDVRISYGGYNWRVVKVEDDPSGVAVNFICKNETE